MVTDGRSKRQIKRRIKMLKSFAIYFGVRDHYGKGNAEDGKMSI
jgi:hypothetical protein